MACLAVFTVKGPFKFFRLSQKVKVLELRVVISANINMHIPVILSLKPSLYDLQKLRYRVPTWAPY